MSKYIDRAMKAWKYRNWMKEDKNKTLYSMECGIGFHNGDTIAPFIVAIWDHKDPDVMKIVVFDGK